MKSRDYYQISQNLRSVPQIYPPRFRPLESNQRRRKKNEEKKNAYFYAFLCQTISTRSLLIFTINFFLCFSRLEALEIRSTPMKILLLMCSILSVLGEPSATQKVPDSNTNVVKTNRCRNERCYFKHTSVNIQLYFNIRIEF